MSLEPIPAPPSAARDVNLLTTARLVSDGARWENGITFRPEPCGPGDTLDPFCVAPSGGTKSSGEAAGVVEWMPYGLHLADECAYTLNQDTFTELTQRVRRALLAQTSEMIESVLWTNVVDGTAFGAGGEGHPNVGLIDAPVTGTPAPPVNALAQMDQLLAQAIGGKQGMIHVPAYLMHQLAFYGLVRREGNTWRTVTGHLVAPGTGYPGTDPDGNDDGNVWIYGTSMVEIRLSEVAVLPNTLPEAIDRATNQLVVRAERLALAYWDRCAHVGVPVCDTDPGPECGSES